MSRWAHHSASTRGLSFIPHVLTELLLSAVLSAGTKSLVIETDQSFPSDVPENNPKECKCNLSGDRFVGCGSALKKAGNTWREEE